MVAQAQVRRLEDMVSDLKEIVSRDRCDPHLSDFMERLFIEAVEESSQKNLKGRDVFSEVRDTWSWTVKPEEYLYPQQMTVPRKIFDWVSENLDSPRRNFFTRPGIRNKIFWTEDGQRRSVRVSEIGKIIRDDPYYSEEDKEILLEELQSLGVQKEMGKLPSMKPLQLDLEISTDPVDLMTKSTGRFWTSCETLGGGSHQRGTVSDVKANNAIAIFRTGGKDSWAGRVMLRWCEDENGDGDIGIETSFYGNPSIQKVAVKKLKEVLKEKGFLRYKEGGSWCITPYCYHGFSDTMGRGDTRIRYGMGGVENPEELREGCVDKTVATSVVQAFIDEFRDDNRWILNEYPDEFEDIFYEINIADVLEDAWEIMIEDYEMDGSLRSDEYYTPEDYHYDWSDESDFHAWNMLEAEAIKTFNSLREAGHEYMVAPVRRSIDENTLSATVSTVVPVRPRSKIGSDDIDFSEGGLYDFMEKYSHMAFAFEDFNDCVEGKADTIEGCYDSNLYDVLGNKSETFLLTEESVKSLKRDDLAVLCEQFEGVTQFHQPDSTQLGITPNLSNSENRGVRLLFKRCRPDLFTKPGQRRITEF